MSLQASQQWWVRTDGDNANGGGFDAAISGAGTNYCDQAAAVLVVTDIACANSTTVTSATGGFTSAMIGNLIRISGGTNFTDGFYAITARASTTSITVDRNPTTGASATGGRGAVGGAFAHVTPFSTGGGVGAASVPTGLAPGHIVNIRGTGNSDGAVDYAAPAGDYMTITDASDEAIKFIGYNGRPCFGFNGILFYNLTGGHVFKSIKGICGTVAFAVYGLAHGGHIEDVIIDANGGDCRLVTALSTRNLWLKNTGSTATGSQEGFFAANYAGPHQGLLIENLRGVGMSLDMMSMVHVSDFVVRGCGSHGIRFTGTATTNYGCSISRGVLHGNAGSGFYFVENGLQNMSIDSCIFSENGGYGINVTDGTAALNLRRSRKLPKNNAFYSNTSGSYNNFAGGDGDVILSASPFVDAAGGDFTLNSTAGAGAACRSAGFPTRIGSAGAQNSYVDVGALQAQPSAGGGSSYSRGRVVNN